MKKKRWKNKSWSEVHSAMATLQSNLGPCGWVHLLAAWVGLQVLPG